MTRPKPTTQAPKIAFVSLGCSKNLVDSEVLLGNLTQSGCILCGDPDDADVVVINTCAFIDAAEEESYNAIREALRWKEAGRIKAVVVAGCMASRYRASIKEKLPGVDGFLGVFDRDAIVRICERAVDKGNDQDIRAKIPAFSVTDPDAPGLDTGRWRLTPRHYAYLKISEGCNHTCAFCVIPRIRGTFRSKPMEHILEEATELASDGAKELILIAQDSTYYGMDTHRKQRLPQLLDALADVPGVAWIRIMYAYPALMSEAIIDGMASTPKVLPYIDMPLQHLEQDMLTRMSRGTTAQFQYRLLQKMREKIPDLVIRTTMLTGFPGETEDQFDYLCKAIKRMKFDRLGAFTYRREQHTDAHAMPGQISEQEKERRRDKIMEIQHAITMERNAGWVGRSVPVIVDEVLPEKHPFDYMGRTYGDAPDVDGLVYLKGHGRQAGDILQATITGFDEYDLVGEIPAP